jgi:hypothetical protein
MVDVRRVVMILDPLGTRVIRYVLIGNIILWVVLVYLLVLAVR